MSLNETEMDFLLSSVTNSVWQHRSLTPCHWDTGRTCRWSITWGPAGERYLFGLRAGATVELWSGNRFAGSDTAAPKPEEERMLIHIWPVCEIWCQVACISGGYFLDRCDLGQKWFEFSETFLGSSVWSAAKPPRAELNVWWLMEKQF